LIIEGFLGRCSASCRDDADELAVVLDMYDREQMTCGTEADHSIPRLVAPTGIPKDE
jgi:hypothetical protein